MLFNDTVVCPACRHILDAERAAMLGDFEDLAKSRSEQIPCRSCGEANQIGLVRCWNCSAFLREDIQEAYYAMLRSQREVVYSQPGSHAEHQERQKPSQPGGSNSGGDDDDDDDFELSENYRLNHPDEEDASGTYRITDSPEDEAASSNGSGSEAAAQPKSEADQDAAQNESGERRRPSQEDNADTEDHSVATGGDVLLDIALREEAEREKVRKRREAAIKQKQARRKGGKAEAGAGAGSSQESPSPERLAAQKKALARRKAAKRKAEEKKKKFGVWLSDVRLHKVNPQKMKLKPGCEEKQFEPVDVGCSSAGVIVVSLAKKPAFALFSKSKSDPEETRKEVRAHLETEKAIKDVPAPEHEFLEGDAIGQIKVVQPAAYVHESMFAGVPVFGEGRIAVRLPVQSDSPEHRFLSFWLTEFRKFSQAMEKLLGIKDLGHLEGVPLTDPVLDLSCQYSEEALKAIDPEAIKFFEADPEIKLELIGRRCEGCGIAISEDARRKEKIGGLNGKSIAKAKCPKCEKKFGSISLFKVGESESDKKSAESAKKAPASS